MNIYVGNLSLDITEDELKREFMAFGTVVSVTLMNDRYIGSGQTDGYAFVEMASTAEGKVAIDNLSGKQLLGRELEIVEALPLSGDSDKRSHHGHTVGRSGKKRHR